VIIIALSLINLSGCQLNCYYDNASEAWKWIFGCYFKVQITLTLSQIF